MNGLQILEEGEMSLSFLLEYTAQNHKSQCISWHIPKNMAQAWIVCVHGS